MEELAKLNEIPIGLARDQAIAEWLSTFQAADFAAGADQLLSLLKRSNKFFDSSGEELAEAWMDRWMELDTPGALRFLSSSTFLSELPTAELRGWPIEDRSRCSAGGALRVLARREPKWLRQTITALKLSPTREIGVYMLLREMSQRGTARDAQVLASFKDDPDRPAAVSGYVGGLANVDTRAAFDIALAESPGPLREALLSRVVRSIGKKGVSAAREMLEQVDDPILRQKLAVDAVRTIGFDTSEDALPLIQEVSERMAATGALKSGIADWASSVEVAARGPQAARFAEWALDFAPDTNKEVFAKIAGAWAGRAPAEFCDWLSKYADRLDPSVVNRLGEPLGKLARRNLAATREWADALPAGALRDQAYFQVAVGYSAEGDLTQAAAAYETVAASDSKGMLAKQLAATLAEHDGGVAAEWAMGLPPGPARKEALGAIAEGWTKRDPHGAAQWLTQMPASAERDSAVQTYAMQVAVADPQIAAEWAEQISDPAVRTQTATTVYYYWFRENPPAARAWLRDVPGVETGLLARLLRNTR